MPQQPGTLFEVQIIPNAPRLIKMQKTMENFAYCYDNSVLINTQLLTLNDKLTRHLYHKNTLSAILQSYTANSSLIYEKDIRNWGCFRHIITTIFKK